MVYYVNYIIIKVLREKQTEGALQLKCCRAPHSSAPPLLYLHSPPDVFSPSFLTVDIVHVPMTSDVHP